MLFNSYGFIFVFLPVVLAGYFRITNCTLSSLWLLVSSLIFYSMLSVNYLPVLIISVCMNYFVSRRIESGHAKRLWLMLGIAFNFIMLGYFKFTGTLPPGISFFTFTQTAYIVCVFKGSAKTESFMKYSEYAAFFPYVISGPISDYRDIMPQLKDESKRRVNYDNLALGITLFILGLFKKVYIADGLAPVVNNLFANSGGLTFFEAWFAALSYSMQLYFDFSGYSDMAVAIALMFNIKLPVNFDSPYKSLSIIDFWRRWHISLGKWIRDYVYIPLGGSREGEVKKIRNVILAMLFTGLWHGVGFTFILWGLLHGLMLAVNHQWRRLNVKIPSLLSWFITFICVVSCWIIFRSESVNDAVNILAAMFDVRNIVLPEKLIRYAGFLKAYGITFGNFLMNNTAKNFAFLLVIFVMSVLFPNTNQIISRFKPRIIYAVLIFIIAVMSMMKFSGISDFLYFQF
ncbi:MAG: MBOAT family protein [Synergistaceae bacterium]|nr:MBOAT family protein [Synergistaceae bacterium]MBQ3693495.1 MBOAT family protein [Synergistaceae bacterium]MBQ9629209.1 MBOAT family protein [Synergistaceae bacterium]MBR0069920.1 MBOAT family protein [Synergistaceae bacterium]MBR0251651.1 MBOAT family protein [Synergistaceae bacterium]